MRLAAIAQPVSVCHQWSMTGTPSSSLAHVKVSGSRRSPARKRYLNELMSYFFSNSPLGSSRFTARKPVGAVKSAFTPYSPITRQ